MLSLFAALLLFAGCNNSKKTTESAAAQEQAAKTAAAEQAPAQTAPVESTPVETAEAEAAPEQAAPAATAPVEPVAEEPAPAAAPVKSAPAVSPASNVTAAVTQAATETSPAILFQKCAACHGNHAEKSALNQSAVIGEWDSKRIAAAVTGYQQGTYGRAMKTLMQNQVKELTPDQVYALAEYISNLNVKTH